MRAIVTRQRGTGLWRVVGVSRLTGEAVVHALFPTWGEAIAWATGDQPRPPRANNLRRLEAMLGRRAAARGERRR